MCIHTLYICSIYIYSHCINTDFFHFFFSEVFLKLITVKVTCFRCVPTEWKKRKNKPMYTITLSTLLRQLAMYGICLKTESSFTPSMQLRLCLSENKTLSCGTKYGNLWKS